MYKVTFRLKVCKVFQNKSPLFTAISDLYKQIKTEVMIPNMSTLLHSVLLLTHSAS